MRGRGAQPGPIPLVALVLLTAAIVGTSAGALSSQRADLAARALPPRAASLPSAEPPPAPGPILVRIFRGLPVASREEVSVTTIFPGPTFSVLADVGMDAASDAALSAHVREVFSLEELVSLGSSVVPLDGGSAILDGDGQPVTLRLRGERVGPRAVRLEVTEIRDGQEVVATRVIARIGKTVVLAGPGGRQAGRASEASFICLTPLE